MCRATLPLEALRENLFLVSSSVCGCQHSLACGHITPVSASVFTWPSFLSVLFSSCKDTSHWVYSPTQKTILLVLNLMTSAETQSPLSSHSQIVGLALVNVSLWGTLFNPVQTNSHDVSKTHFFQQPRALVSNPHPTPPPAPSPGLN